MRMKRSTANTTSYTARRKRVASAYLEGKSQLEIAEAEGVNQATISRDLSALREEWLQSSLMEFNQLKARELARIDKLEETYWAAWHRSVGEHIKTTSTRDTDNVTTAKVVKETLVGNAVYLSGIQWCIEQRCKIFGLYLEAKTAPDWRKAIEDQGHDAGTVFEHMVNALVYQLDADAKEANDSRGAA